MADNKLIGQNYTTPDLVAKVTGKAKYAEDYRVEGMLFAKLLCSPMPHARVTRLDTSKALAMPGVKAILTADDMPGAAAGATLGEGVQATAQTERGLTNEPLYQGEPILAVAADRRAHRRAKRSKRSTSSSSRCPSSSIRLKACGPAARTRARRATCGCVPPRRRRRRARRGPTNAAAGASAAAPRTPTPTGPAGEQRGRRPGRSARSGAGRRRSGRAAPHRQPAGRGGRGAAAAGPPPPQIVGVEVDRRGLRQRAGAGQMPMGKATDEWTFGNVEEGLKKADLVLDETFMTQSTGHQPLETRTAMAYWQNGKLHLHGSTQSTVQTVASVARWTGITPDKVVIISEYTGGGFGSKIPGAISMAIPALLSKKANAPVMMRITREEEHFIGRARPGILARVKMGFRKDGRITAIDMYTIQRQRSVRRAGRLPLRGQHRCRSPISPKRCGGAA